MIWEGFPHRICFKPEITGHKVEPDHFAEKTLRGREPAVSFHVWLYPRLRGTSPSWSHSERKHLLKLKRVGLTNGLGLAISLGPAVGDLLSEPTFSGGGVLRP